MQLDLLDNNVNLTMNVFIVIANILNLAYNIPQMLKTYQRKTTADISGMFLSLRFVTTIIWIAYAIEINSLLFLINNIVTIISTLFIGYYKAKEIYMERKIAQSNKTLEFEDTEYLN